MTFSFGFERYRDIVDDWASFIDASHSPLPICIWTNLLRTSPGDLSRRLETESVRVHPLRWYDAAFRFESDVNPGTTLSYHAGLYNVQEEVSLLPVVALAPRPGARVLDLCAAPGNKTLQAAVALENQGTVVANDRSGGRLNPLRTALYRFGLTNVTTTNYDAARFPLADSAFDCVIADVPCSCEGNSRKHPDVEKRASREQSVSLARTQVNILRRAVDLCRPGGRIVYGTCTYAPEENEMVVDAILRAMPEVRIRPFRLPGLVHSAGLTDWESMPLHEDLTRTIRVWPHQNDTGGFYVALLEKAR